MPDLFGGDLAALYYNWQQNRSICSFVICGVVKLIKKDPYKESIIDNFWSIILLHLGLKIVAMLLAETSALVIEKQVGRA